MPSSQRQTLVIEDAVIERRLRRPIDLARFASAVLTIVAVGLLAYVAHQTTSGIDQDISQGANKLPGVVILIANIVSGFGAIVFPAVVALDLMLRKRGRQLVEALAGMLGTIFLLALATWALNKFGSIRLISSFAGSGNRNTATPFNALLGGLAALVTVARLFSRPRWSVACSVVLISVGLGDIVSGGVTAAGLAVSVLTGWAVGLLIRYLLGTDSTRPSGMDVANTLGTIGLPLALLRAARVLSSGRRYDATTSDGERLDLVVLDRDLEGAGLATAVYRSLRLRDEIGSAGTSMRRRLERTALNSWAISTAGINTPHLIAVAEVGPDAAVLAFNHVPGRTFADLPRPLGDAELVGAWEIIRDLQAARIAHRNLTAENFLLGADGKVYLVGLEDGVIAASDVLLRIDLAEIFCTLAILSDSARAMQSGQLVLGENHLSRALPALQSVAFSTNTRAELKEHNHILAEIREQLVALAPEAKVEQIEIERIKPRTLLTIAGGTIAGYILLTQLAQVDLNQLLASANPIWLLIGFGFSILTYLAATLSLTGVTPERLSFWKTFQAQWAASFATLMAPPTLGSVAVNVRFLTKQGINSALAGASVAVAQVLAFFSHVGLLLIAAIAAGTANDLSFAPPKIAVIIFVILVLAIAIALSFAKVRREIIKRVKPIISQVIPRLASLLNHPRQLSQGIGGVLLLNLSYCFCLIACVHAFSPQVSIAGVALVYLGSSVVAQAAPTPGGLGAVEAAIAAGLTATGIQGEIAVSATLLFRLWTFWLPTIPGWLAFGRLQKSGDL
ncbi:MAG: flippase-like domain-containing protein [Actinomycetales bacterium]|nr:flippase-like domain-containing protein [Actinomycetales bacterium]